MPDEPAKLPFNDIRVVALEQAVAAPFCSRQLADMGADVIKVERPVSGDFARGYGTELNGTSAYFAWLNRGKRSITLDLKNQDDLNIFEKLIKRADVFIHNLAPGSVERLGFGYDEIKQRYPRLIWCGISGYGSEGPYQSKKAYDMLIQAESGIVSLTGSTSAPAKVGVSIADISSGLYAYSSIITALWNRAHTGNGTRIDISMLECLVEWVMPPVYAYYGTGKFPERAGSRHNMIVPYGAYSCADGEVIFAVQNDREWSRFCEIVLGQQQVATDDRYSSNAARLENRATLEPLIERIFSQLKCVDVIERLEAASIANAHLNSIPDVLDHPQLKARQRWSEVKTPNGFIPALIPPHNIGDIPSYMGDIPELGEHTESILDELKGE